MLARPWGRPISDTLMAGEKAVYSLVLYSLLCILCLHAWSHPVVHTSLIDNGRKAWGIQTQYKHFRLINCLKNKLWLWLWYNEYPHREFVYVKILQFISKKNKMTSRYQASRKAWSFHFFQFIIFIDIIIIIERDLCNLRWILSWV